MYILGFNCFKHDASATLMSDGEIIAAAEEERFIGTKHTFQFPVNAIKFCLNKAGITECDLNYICFYWKPLKFLWHQGIKHYIKYFPVSHGLRQKEVLKSWFFYQTVKSRFFRYFPKAKHGNWKFTFIDHHLAHAASAFNISGFDSAAILVIDGTGEIATASMYYGSGINIRKIKEIRFPHSLGYFYSAITHYLGFEPNEDEYKIMGLSSYGKPAFLDEFRKIILPTKDGGFRLDLSYFDYYCSSLKNNGLWVSKKFLKIFGGQRRENDMISERHIDIAASAQKILEKTCLHMAVHLRKKTDAEYLCLNGGVALNCVMNGKIVQEAGFKDIFIQPAANDAGSSLGACLYFYHQILGKSRNVKMHHVYFGPDYENKEIEQILQLSKLRQKKCDNITKIGAKLIASGKIVGWFQGRMEFGPRALGNRSILADPRRPDMKDILNEYVKFREDFRPFAPSVLAEKVSQWFTPNHDSPFMILVHDVLSEKRKTIPAVTHVDGTARVHTVTKKSNPLYYRLIKEFEKITGVPIVLNTSFNVKGQPIVRTPKDAIECFFSTGLDFLIIGNYLVEK